MATFRITHATRTTRLLNCFDTKFRQLRTAARAMTEDILQTKDNITEDKLNELRILNTKARAANENMKYHMDVIERIRTKNVGMSVSWPFVKGGLSD